MSKRIPYVVYTDNLSLDNHKLKVQMAQNGYQRILDQFAALNIGPLTPDEVYPLMMNPVGFVQTRCLSLLPAAKSVGQFKVKQSALLDQLELPNITMLQDAISFAKTLPIGFGSFLVKDGKVIIEQETLESMFNTFKVFARTEAQAQAAEAYEEYRNAYIKLDALVKAHGNISGLAHLQQQNVFAYSPTAELQFNVNFYNSLIN